MKKFERKFWRGYKLLCALRILLVFIPQTGYIHPDEYFQSIEILAGDTFDLDTNRPWEFNMTSPVRSISTQYFTVGLSYKILSTINVLVRSFFQTSIVSPYMLLITPRLLICLLSFSCDYSMYQVCVANNEKYKSRLLILSSSYALIVYGTRTFSNTLEMIFFSLLLYCVSESMIFSHVIVKHQEYFKRRYDKSESVVDKAKFHKMTLFLAPHNYRNFFAVSTITVLGIFNRPTFLCYAVIPVFFWLFRSIGSKIVTPMQFHVRSIIIILAAIPTVLILVVIDSFYFGYMTWGEIGMLDISIDNFVFPSFNFIRYNWNEKNLEKHGKHPIYMHLFVNIPLLFTVLGIFTLIGFGDLFNKLLKRKYHLLPSIRSVKGLMTTSIIAPLGLLSSFAHQEPRFIIPIIFPMVYLYANKIYEEPDYSIVEVKEEKNEVTAPKKIQPKSQVIFKLWLGANAILTVFYGFIHQGGIYSAYNFLSKEVRVHPNTQYNIFTSHVYSIPYSMLLQPKTDKVYFSSTTKFQKTKRVFLYEQGSSEILAVLKKITSIAKVLNSKNVRYKSLYVHPSSLDRILMEEIRANYVNVHLKKVKTIYPHLSTEALPDFTDFIHKIAYMDMKSLHFVDLWSSFCDIFKSFGLSIYYIDVT